MSQSRPLPSGLSSLDFLWEFVVPGETTEEYFLGLAGKPLRKIDEKEKTIYLYQGKGIISDSVTVKEGRVILLDFTPSSRLFLMEVIKLLGEFPDQKGKSNLNNTAAIYDFSNNGIAVTVNNKEEVLRITRHEAEKPLEIKKTTSISTIEMTAKVQNTALISGVVILIIITILILITMKRRKIH